MRRAVLAILTLLLVQPVLSGPQSDPFAQRKKGAGTTRVKGDVRPQPNFLVLVIDDLDFDLLTEPVIQAFPTLDALRRRSLRFSNAFVTTPLCGPQRAAQFRGQYAHSTGILTNVQGTSGLLDEPTGSYAVFFNQGFDEENLAPVMDAAGYRTLLVGKYLHAEFPGPAGPGSVPAGWDEFYSTRGGGYFGTNRYVNGANGWFPDDVYRTDGEGDDALRLLRETGDEPWMLYVAPFGVHQQVDQNPMFAPRHAALFSGWELPATPDWNVEDEWGIYDQPASAAIVESWHELYRDRLRALMAIDEMMADLLSEIEARREERHTYVIVTSDNGLLTGHFRHSGKSMPWDRALRVPLWVAGPGVTVGVTDRLASTADIAPTLIELARSAVPDYMDGRSLRPVFGDPDLVPASWRKAILAEGALWFRWSPTMPQNKVHESRWSALITETEKYVEFSDGRWMHHDLASDPYEVVPTSSSSVDREAWSASLALYEQCGGGGCVGRTPETSIDTPNGSFLPATGGFRVSGSAQMGEDQILSSVRVILFNFVTGLYWNGSGWQPDLTRIHADLTPAAPGVFRWDYDFAGSVAEGQDVRVIARAYGDTGIWDPSPASARFVLRDEAGDSPETHIVWPSSLVPGVARIGGWVVDRSGVDRVELTHNGQPVPVTLGPPPRGKLLRTWTAEVTLVPGLNRLSAVGVDRTGTADPSPAEREFTLN